jgi:uncharacterized membrane protein
MIDGLPLVVTAAAAIGAGVNAGVFLAFSTFVMRALGGLPAAQGMSAMQAINREAPTPVFMTALFGTAAICVAAAVVALTKWGEPWAPYVLAGALLYLVCPVATAVYHVPRNNALARADAGGAAAAETWARWHPAWTRGNHVRTIACLASALTFLMALRVS